MIQIAAFFLLEVKKMRWPRWVGALQQSDPPCNSTGPERSIDELDEARG